MFDGMTLRQNDPQTFGEPGEVTPLSTKIYDWTAGAVLDPIQHPEKYADIFRTSERQTRTVDNVFARDRATEEAYDRRIAAVKAATGQTLDNPMRGQFTERELRRLNRDGPVDPAAIKRQQFEQRLEELRGAHPDQAEALTFGDVDAEARDVARGAEKAAHEASEGANPVAGFVTGMAGGMYAGRRDPLFVGSLFAGPVGAVGKTALARIVDSGIRQGLYNAGLSAIEQPAVQAWRREVGVRSGLEPALENVGFAFLFGAIPGAALRGLHEIGAARGSVERVLNGHPEPGDVDAAVKSVGAGLTETERNAVRIGEDMQAADRVTEVPPPKDMPANWPASMHDDMTAAALKQADDPNAPSPMAVAMTATPDAMPADIRQRIEAANPRDAHEAQVAADEALDDAGRRQGMAVQSAQIAEGADQRLHFGAAYAEAMAANPPARGDPLGKVPFAREDGSPVMLTAKAAAAQGEREANLAMLIRSCK